MNELDELKELLRKHKTQYTKILKHDNYKHLLEYVLNNSKLLDDPKYKLDQRINFVINEMKDFPKCHNPNCNKVLDNPKYYGGQHFGYRKYCCSRCSTLDKETQIKMKETTKNRYGNENFRNIKQRKETFIRHYGVDNNMKSKEGYEKYHESIRKKYGVDNQFQREEIKQKSMKTKIDLYGDPNYNNIEKQRKTFKKNIQVNPNFYQERENVKKQTCIRKYGVTHQLKNEKIKQKVLQNRKPTIFYLYNNIKYRSYPELSFAVYLTENNISFKYEDKDIWMEYYDKNNEKHIYIPDFYLIETNQIIEIKGDNQFRNKDPNDILISLKGKEYDHIAKAKYECMIKNGVKIYSSKDYNKYIKYVEDKYGKKFKIEHKVNQMKMKNINVNK